MRRKLVAGNWKMHGDVAVVEELHALGAEGAADVLTEFRIPTIIDNDHVQPRQVQPLRNEGVVETFGFRVAQHAFDLEQRPAADQMLELAEAWRPWRAVSARLLWAYYAVLKQGRSGIGL